VDNWRSYRDGGSDLDQSLETDRLIIRRFELGDAPDLFALRSDPTVSQYDSWEPYASRDEARRFIESQKHVEPGTEGQWCQWAVVLQSDSKVIGSVEMVIRSRRWGQAEIGWALNRVYRGMGYATEAARRMITFGFDDLGLHRISAECDPGNTASVRLMERLGMRREGHLREIIVVKGVWCDRYVYAVLAHEWDKL